MTTTSKRKRPGKREAFRALQLLECDSRSTNYMGTILIDMARRSEA
jgi:hypothetical protein